LENGLQKGSAGKIVCGELAKEACAKNAQADESLLSEARWPS